MSKFGKALAAVALVAALGATQAQAQSRFVIGGGSTIGLSDVKQTANGGFSNGPSLLVGYEYVTKSGFGVRVDGMYHRIQGDDQAQTPGGPATFSSRLQVFNGTLNALYVLPTAGSVKPYLIAGVGYYSYKPTGSAYSGATVDSQSDFGFNAGAGFEGGKKVIFFGEARFHQIQSKDDAVAGSFNTRVLPITVGVKLPFGAK